MNGKIVIITILLISGFAGAALYYLQVYGYYYDVAPQAGRDVMLVARATGAPEPIAYSDFRAIDANSSPIRYRACFTTPVSPAELATTRVTLADARPRIAPAWFDCFDTAALAGALAAGTATAFLGTRNIAYGVDRIVAITRGGRGYVWHELNDCGKKSYDGSFVTGACPPLPPPATGR